MAQKWGEKAYKYAKATEHGGPKDKERWTDDRDKKERIEEYERVSEIMRKKQKMQELSELKHVGEEPYEFKKGDTLYEVVSDHFGMNKRTSFLVMVNMLRKNNINVDLWRPEDTIWINNDGSIGYTRAKQDGSTEEGVVEGALSIATDDEEAPGGASGPLVKPDTRVEDEAAGEGEAPDAPRAPDATRPDGSAPDVSPPDAGVGDAMTRDAAAPDASTPDATATDATAPHTNPDGGVALPPAPPHEPRDRRTTAHASRERTRASTEIAAEHFDFTTAEMRRMRGYYLSYLKIERHRETGMISRTYAHRQDDGIHFLRDARNGASDETQALAVELFKDRPAPVFIDIGAGVANKEAPGITSQEMATAFPDMRVYALDLPDQVEEYNRKVLQKKRAALEATENLTIVAGDGLKPLKDQVPSVPNGTPIIIRAANSIDIYCKWSQVEPALSAMATDFKDHPVLLFWNQEIIFKEAGTESFKIIGQLSERGFRHNSRSLSGGGPPYKLKKEAVATASD